MSTRTFRPSAAPGAERAPAATDEEPAAPAAIPPAYWRHYGIDLQRKLESPIQHKRVVSDEGDAAEQEADRLGERMAAGAGAGAPSVGAAPLAVQAKAADGREASVPAELDASLARSRGGGAALPDGLRGQFEGHLGRDLGGVRVHDDGEAHRHAESMNARAFTSGRDIYFGAGEYAPASSSGRQLLAHEVVHTVQQGGGGDRPPILRALKSKRLKAGELWRIESEENNEMSEKSGHAAADVRYVQQALCDLDFPVGVTGVYDEATTKAMLAFQVKHGVGNGKGRLDQATLRKMDALFLSFTGYADSAKSGGAGPRALSKEEMAAAGKIFKAEKIDLLTMGKAAPALDENEQKKKDEKPGEEDPQKLEAYRAAVLKAMTAEIDLMVKNLVADKPQRRSEGVTLRSNDTVQSIANAGKVVTDALFGKHKQGAAPHTGANIKDQWAKVEETFQEPKAAKSLMLARLKHIALNNAGLGSLTPLYGLAHDKPPGKGVVEQVYDQLIAERSQDLFNIERSWPGTHSPATHETTVQLFTAPTPQAEIDERWKLLQTMVHEYMHSLAHDAFRKFYDSQRKTNPKLSNALREGTTDFLTKIVLSSLDPGDLGLRKSVEGELFNPERPPTFKWKDFYPMIGDVEQVVGIIGVQNLYACYFTGNKEALGIVRRSAPSDNNNAPPETTTTTTTSMEIDKDH